MIDFKNNPDFFPTPYSVFEKMADKIRDKHYSKILEPSAGKGDLAIYIDIYNSIISDIRSNEKFKEVMSYKIVNYAPSRRTSAVDVIELNPELRAELKNKGFNIVGDDFLKFQTNFKYGLVFANFPFSNGAKHFLKAIELQETYGGDIVAIVNSQTVLNPCNNERKYLQAKLKEYDAEIEIVDNAFQKAERSSDVQIAIVYLSIPEKENKTVKSLVDSLIKDSKKNSFKGLESNKALISSNPFESLVAEYNFEISLGEKLISIYDELKPVMGQEKRGETVYTLSLNLDGKENISMENFNEYVVRVRDKYWRKLTESPSFDKNMNEETRHIYYESLSSLSNYEFTLSNIYQVLMNLLSNTADTIKDTVLKWFDKLTYSHSLDCCSNIHYFNGWRTNKSFIINKKVIIPMYNLYDKFLERFDFWGAERYLKDLELTLAYFDLSHERDEFPSVSDVLSSLKDAVCYRNIHFRYFTADFYKKGTIHLVFNDEKLLKRFNIYGSQHKGWLPPAYCKKAYEDMSDEERAVIDSFQGREEYETIFEERDSYLIEINNKFLLPELSETVSA